MVFEIYRECFEIGELIGKHLTGKIRIGDYPLRFNDVSPEQHYRIMEILGIHSYSTKQEIRDYFIHVNWNTPKNGGLKIKVKPSQESAPTTQENAQTA